MKKSILITLFNIASILSFAQITLVLNPGPAAGKDANIRTDQPNANNGNGIDYIANAFTAQGNFFIQRSLMQFDLSSIPANAIITDANLSLFCNTTSGHAQYQYGENVCVLQRIIQNWDEFTVTWDNQPMTTTSHEVVLPQSSSNTQDYPGINVTQLVKDMISYPEESYGLMIRLITEETYRTMVFGSSDHADPSKWPSLIISYDTCHDSPLTVSYSYTVSDSLNVAFWDQSAGAAEWYWDFGDGSQSTLQNPVHTYAMSGNYLVCLTGRNSCYSATYCDSIEFCNSVIAEYDFEYLNDTLLSFVDESSNATSWHWDFGDGYYSDLQNPVHSFYDGTYNVCLKGINACSYSMKCHRVEVHDTTEQKIITDPIIVYPNPSQSGFRIKLPDSPKGTRLFVHDISGHLVFGKEFDINIPEVQIPALEQGIYSLTIRTNNKVYYYKILSQ